MTISNEQHIAQSLIGTMRGRGHLENHGNGTRANGGFCVVRDEVSYPELVDVAKWLTVELMGRDALTTRPAYWLIPEHRRTGKIFSSKSTRRLRHCPSII